MTKQLNNQTTKQLYILLRLIAVFIERLFHAPYDEGGQYGEGKEGYYARQCVGQRIVVEHTQLVD